MAIDFYFDLRNGKFLSDLRASGVGGAGNWTLRRFLHNESPTIRWTFLELNSSGDITNPNAIVAAEGGALTVSVYAADLSTLLATTAPGGWVGDSATHTLAGQLNLNTVQMAAQFGAGVVAINAQLEIQLTLAAAVYGFRIPMPIDKSLIAGAVPQNITQAGYLTREESIALFVKYVGNPNGSTIVLSSPDGTKTLIFGERNDGSVQMDQI